MQSTADTHITLHPDHLAYINHSCNPNVFFDLPSEELVALKPITPGTHLTFFYPSTEWAMHESFECQCGEIGHCVGQVQGAKYLLPAKLKQYRLAPHIASQLRD